MKVKANVKRLIKVSIFVAGSAFMLAACVATVKNTNIANGKTPDLHSDPDMHAKMKAAAPEGNVDATGKSEVQITIDNFVFSPSDVTISPGTKVTWINKDEAPHTATSSDKKFNSGGLDTDDNFSFVFNDKGEYPYICTLHPQMKATIKVK